jgi:putative endonuclease
MMSATWHVYMLRCADGTLYTGVARDLDRRLLQHNGERAGGPKYTRGRRPVQLVWSEPAPDRSSAQQREAAIKQLKRQDKLQLTFGNNTGVSPGPSESC